MFASRKLYWANSKVLNSVEVNCEGRNWPQDNNFNLASEDSPDSGSDTGKANFHHILAIGINAVVLRVENFL